MDPFTIFAVASAIFGGASVVKQAEAARHAKKSEAVQRQSVNLRAAKERRSAIRDSRIAFAVAQQNAENQGVGGSSGAYGGQGSIYTQGNANLSFLDQQLALSNQAGMYMDKAASDNNAASAWSGMAQLTAAGASYFGSKSAPQSQPKIPNMSIPKMDAWNLVASGIRQQMPSPQGFYARTPPGL